LLKYSTRARRRMRHQRFLPCHDSRRVDVLCTIPEGQVVSQFEISLGK
jgi:hypothetical protein